jgi:acyl-CoA hydrolase
MQGKRVSDSSVVMPVRMMPQDANPAGFVHAGVVLKNIDLAGAIVAMHHARTAVVTVSIDRMDFLCVANVGEALLFKGGLNYVGTSSMEVGVRVEAENLFTGETRHAASAYVTFVAVGEDRKPTPVPALILETPAEQRRFAEAEKRREMRKAERKAERAAQGGSAPDPAAWAAAVKAMERPEGGIPVARSSVVMPVRMMPQDANPAGNVHGGVTLKNIDLAAAIAAMRHCRRAVVTSSIERMEFLDTGRVGEVMNFAASVNHAEGASMEVGVRVEAENLLTGQSRHAASAYLTFKALDEARQPTPAPPLVIETMQDLRRNMEAARRRDVRRAERLREQVAQAGTDA